MSAPPSFFLEVSMPLLEKDTSGIVGFLFGAGTVGTLATNQTPYVIVFAFSLSVLVLDRISCIQEWWSSRRRPQGSNLAPPD